MNFTLRTLDAAVGIDVKADFTLRMLTRLVATLTGSGRAAVNEGMAEEMAELTRTHLRELAASRHDTANRLGAAPSGFLAQAADKVESSADDQGGTVVVNHPGMGRAFHDVTIVPTGGAKALTIPVAAIAYNRRAGQFSNLFVFKSKTTGNAFLAQRQAEKGDQPLLLFLLVRSVTQKQDRSLLPADDQFADAARRGMINFLTSIS